jgi:uncharacterized phage infection (PIP) family protein YhgE
MLGRGISAGAGLLGRANAFLSGIGNQEDTERNLLKLRLRGANEASALSAAGNEVGAQAVTTRTNAIALYDQLRTSPDARTRQMASSALSTGINQLRGLASSISQGFEGISTSSPDAVNFKGGVSRRSDGALESIDRNIQKLTDAMTKEFQ